MAIEVGLLKFGEIDARNEVFQQARYGSQVFVNAFQVPPRVDLNELISGSRFFIYGQKGCGKTALLLHVRHRALELNCTCHTILFKSGLSEAERQKLGVGSGFEVVRTDQGVAVQYDYTTNWLWFIYKNLVRLINLESVLEGREIATDLKRLFGVDRELHASTFSDLAFNKLKVSAKASLGVKVASADLAAELERLRKDRDEHSPTELIEICESYLAKVKLSTKQRCALFFDELELFWSRPDQKERDLFLIRDLLQSVARVNRALGAESASFVVYASVRSEVLDEVNRVGPEIARDVFDFGVPVNWNVKATADHQPILDIVEAKIQASEIESDQLPTEDVWESYFPEQIHGRNVEDHLLDIAMFKPRHIVSRLNLAKTHNPQAAFISSESLDETSTEFSSTVWREVEEELLVTFSGKYVSSLKALLTGFKSKFTIDQFEKRISTLGLVDPSLSDGLRSRADVVNCLKALYRVGALGNRFSVQDGAKTVQRDRWVFREYSEPAIDSTFVVHESLRKIFQLAFD